MGDVVNLRRVRKNKARAAEAETAAENRRRHGRTKGERDVAGAERASLERVLDGARLDEEPDRPGKR